MWFDGCDWVVVLRVWVFGGWGVSGCVFLWFFFLSLVLGLVLDMYIVGRGLVVVWSGKFI